MLFDQMQNYELKPNVNFFAVRKKELPNEVWASYILGEHSMMTACFKDNNLVFLQFDNNIAVNPNYVVFGSQQRLSYTDPTLSLLLTHAESKPILSNVGPKSLKMEDLTNSLLDNAKNLDGTLRQTILVKTYAPKRHMVETIASHLDSDETEGCFALQDFVFPKGTLLVNPKTQDISKVKTETTLIDFLTGTFLDTPDSLGMPWNIVRFGAEKDRVRLDFSSIPDMKNTYSAAAMNPEKEILVFDVWKSELGFAEVHRTALEKNGDAYYVRRLQHDIDMRFCPLPNSDTKEPEFYHVEDRVFENKELWPEACKEFASLCKETEEKVNNSTKGSFVYSVALEKAHAFVLREQRKEREQERKTNLEYTSKQSQAYKILDKNSKTIRNWLSR